MPSASSYAYLRTRPPPSGDRVVAIGNPTLSGGGAARDRGLPLDRVGWLKPLAFAGEELRTLGRLFPGASGTLEGDRATENALADADVSRAAILHFATHGLIDEEHPDRSGLALTPVPPASENTRIRLTSSMNACVSPRLADPARFSTTRRSI